MPHPRVRALAHQLVFAFVLLASAALHESPNSAVDQAIVWLPTGVGIAGLWLLGSRACWVIAAVTVVQRLVLGYDLLVGLPAAAGSTAEALLGLFLLRRLGYRASLERLADVAVLLATAAIAPLGSIFFSWIGRSFVWPNPNMPFYSGWDGWWRMNALGVLAVVPIVTHWATIPRRDVTPRFLLGTVAAVIGVPALLGGFMGLVPRDITGVLGVYLVLVFMLYAAVRFGVRGATLAGALAATTVAFATTHGVGPFLDLPREQRHVAIQLFELAFVAVPAAFAALVAERQAALERGLRSEELLASINRNVNEGLFRTGHGAAVVYANLALAQMFGYDHPAEVVGVVLTDAVAEPGRLEQLRATLEAEGRWVNEEVRLRRRDGSHFWGLLSATAARDGLGRIVQVDGVIADVTARKQLEEQFRQSQKMEAVGKLAGGVAHDFNNLLTVIIGHAELLRAQAGPGSLAAGNAERVLDAAQRASGLTRQLLAYSRQQVLAPRVLDLGEVVRHMGEMVRRLIGEDVALDVTAPESPCWVRVDRSQIEQVLLNLVVNARDAMPVGGHLAITLARRAPEAGAAAGTVVIAVRDTGAGMPAEVQARAFDPFFTTKPPGKGTGLGLSTVQGIVHQSGGTVWLESAPGAGTTVWITLPEVPAPEGESVAEPPRPAAVSVSTVLVVEDEPAVRDLVRQALERAGHRVLAAADGLDALTVARAHAGPIDVVVSDVVMPRMSGREMAAELLRARPELRFLFISGYPDDAGDPRDFVGAAGDFLAKPFSPPLLVERVQALLGARTRPPVPRHGAAGPAAS